MDYNKLSTKELIKEYKNSKRRLKNSIRKVKVEFKPLGYDAKQHKIMGWAFLDENRIELDNSLKGKELLIFAAHEICHLLFWDCPEYQIEKAGVTLGNTLWDLGFRLEK